MSQTVSNEILMRVANIVGLSINDAQDSLAIIDALKGVEKPHGLIAYIRKHRGSVEFKGKTERLDILAQKYKLKELDDRLAKSYKNANKEAVAIAKKVSSCRHFVEENNADWASLRVREEEDVLIPYFNTAEVKLLCLVGSVRGVIQFSRQHTLVAELTRIKKTHIRKEHIQMLKGTQGTHKSVMQEVKKIVRKME